MRRRFDGAGEWYEFGKTASCDNRYYRPVLQARGEKAGSDSDDRGREPLKGAARQSNGSQEFRVHGEVTARHAYAFVERIA
jgi:hypothetical protein